MPSRVTHAITVAAIVCMIVAACGTGEDVPVPGATSPDPATPADAPVTVTETVTETETEAAEPTGEPTATPGMPEEDPMRDLIVSPQEPREVAAGSTAEFSVPGRLGGDDVPDLLGFAWTPCEQVDATQSGTLTFVDQDGDGHADAMGESDTDQARLYTVNGERYENVDDEWPAALHTRDEVPALELTMLADEPDCATLVLFVDEDGDEEFDLGADRTAQETYGVAEASWTD